MSASGLRMSSHAWRIASSPSNSSLPRSSQWHATRWVGGAPGRRLCVYAVSPSELFAGLRERPVALWPTAPRSEAISFSSARAPAT